MLFRKYTLVMVKNPDARDGRLYPFNEPPKISVSRLVKDLKGVSRPSTQNKLWGNALCAPSYFAASCAATPISIIRQ